LTVSANISTSANVVGPVNLWDAATGQFLKAITDNVDGIPNAWGAIFSPDGRRIIVTGQTAAGVWDAESGKLLFPLPGGGSGCCRERPLAVSPDGRFLATALGDLSVQIWDAATDQPLIALRGHKQAVTSANFSPDGERLVTSSDAGMAKVWEARTGRELLTLEGHVSSVRSAVFFPDGHRILTSSYDGTVRIWDAATPQQLAARQQQATAAAKLVAARKAELDNREHAQKEEQAREDAVGAKARADGAAVIVDLARQASDPGAIKQWLVLAPIRIEGRDSETRLEEEQLPGEERLRPHPGERIKVVGNYDGVEDFVWTAVRQEDYRIDLKKIVNFPVHHSLGYMVTYILSDADHSGLLMKVGSDYNAKIYLNGRVVHEQRNPTTFEPDRDKVEGIELKAGLNVLVFKIVQTSRHDWGGSVWITEADGQPVKGIKVTLDPDAVK
jgi:WD40 repeat protein